MKAEHSLLIGKSTSHSKEDFASQQFRDKNCYVTYVSCNFNQKNKAVGNYGKVCTDSYRALDFIRITSLFEYFSGYINQEKQIRQFLKYLKYSHLQGYIKSVLFSCYYSWQILYIFYKSRYLLTYHPNRIRLCFKQKKF